MPWPSTTAEYTAPPGCSASQRMAASIGSQESVPASVTARYSACRLV
jgi:hypothetical protein